MDSAPCTEVNWPFFLSIFSLRHAELLYKDDCQNGVPLGGLHNCQGYVLRAFTSQSRMHVFLTVTQLQRAFNTEENTGFMVQNLSGPSIFPQEMLLSAVVTCVFVLV